MTTVTPDSACPHCRSAFDVTPGSAARLTALQQRHALMAAEWREVALDRRQTERRYGRPSSALSLGLVGCLLLVTAVPLALRSAKVIPSERVLGWIITAGVFGLYALMALALIWVNRRPRGGTAPYPPIILNGPLSASAIDRAEAEADLQARRMHLARAAAGRRASERATRVARAGFFTPANVITLVVVLALVVVGSTADLSRFGGGVEDYLVPYGVAVVVVGLLVLGWLRRRAHVRAVEAALAPLRSWLGGPAHHSYADTVGWLNEYWPLPTTPADAHATRDLVSVEGMRGGYPVLVELQPHGRDDEYATYPSRALIYLATVPAAVASPGDGEADRLRARIELAGFTVRTEPGAGLVARADPATVARLGADLSLLTGVQPVISDLVALATAQGAEPPPIQPPGGVPDPPVALLGD